MIDHPIGENPDLWCVVLDRPTIPMKKRADGETMALKDRKEWDVSEKHAFQNKFGKLYKSHTKKLVKSRYLKLTI